MAVTATRALYIKLGAGDRWADLAFATGTLRFGFRDIPHQQALDAAAARDFQFVKHFYEQGNSKPGVATRFSNEVREFYTAGSDVLWITFVNGQMWWCLADPEVFEITDTECHAKSGSRFRKTVSGWCNRDLNGKLLRTNELRGSLTTTAGFRGTICGVKEYDYLLRRLNGGVTATTLAVGNARSSLIENVIPLIRGLHWKDFELLVELVMTQGGMRRVSATGGTQPTIDLELELPLTREPMFVQIKSVLTQSELKRITPGLAEKAAGARVFVAYHTSPDQLVTSQDNVTLIGPEALSEYVVDIGLTTWVMAKVG